MCAVCEMFQKMTAGAKTLGGIPALKLSELKAVFEALETSDHHAEREAKPGTEAPKAAAEPKPSLFDKLTVKVNSIPPIVDQIAAKLFERMPAAEAEKRVGLVNELFEVLLPLAATLDRETFAAMITDLRGDIGVALQSRDKGTAVRDMMDRLMKPSAEPPPA